MDALKHYEEFVEAIGWVHDSEKSMKGLMEAIRREGVAELTIAKIEQEFDYIISQYKGSLIEVYELEVEKGELKETIDKLNKVICGEELT